MNRKRSFLIILLLVSSALPLLITVPIAKAYSKTTYIVSDYDDVWMTEAGNVFGLSSMVIMLEESIGLHSFLRFQNVDVTRTIKINNATLYVYAGEAQGVSPGASVTIYGIDEPDCTPFTVGSGLWSLSRPYTSASVNWNLTSWSMGWHSVDVTNIVEEIVNQYAWSKGNDLGFQILGAPDTGHESRSFEDYHHPYRETHAKLTIVYDVIEEEEEPPGNGGDVEFVEQYGEYTIWIVDPPGAFGYDQMEYVFTEGTGAPYDLMYDDLDGVGPFKIMDTNNAYASGWGWQRKLARMSDETLYVVYSDGQLYVKQSVDNGTNWTNETRISTAPGMDGWDQYDACMAVDSDDNLHVVFVGANATLVEQIYYVNYTSSWSTPILISTFPGMEDGYLQGPVIAVDSNDYLHVVFYWYGYDPGDEYLYQIWYTKYTDSWTTPIRISTGMQDYFQAIVCIAVESNDDLHVVWEGEGTGFANRQIWYNTYTDSWAMPVRISVYSDMEDYEQYQPVIVLDSSDNLHVVWYGEASGFTTGTQIWYRKYDGSWGAVTRISTYTGMEDYEQGSPNPHAGGLTLASDSDDYIHALWGGKATGLSDQQKVWLATYTDSWATPVCLQPNGRNRGPNLRWSNFPVGAPDDYYIVTDENGTIIPTWNGDNETDIDDLKDWIDDYIDPGGGDPLDPDPGTQEWDQVGPFTRFKMRLYFLFIGLGCIFAPLWAMGYKKFDAVGYTWCFLIMVLGVGLLWSITGI